MIVRQCLPAFFLHFLRFFSVLDIIFETLLYLSCIIGNLSHLFTLFQLLSLTLSRPAGKGRDFFIRDPAAHQVFQFAESVLHFICLLPAGIRKSDPVCTAASRILFLCG